jgi:polyhydroxybutyrate depolymerase
MRLAVAALALVLAACSSSPASTTTSSASSSSGAGGGAGGSGGAAPIGGDRPVDVYVPSGVKPGVPAPLVILLHGYSVNGTVQDLYLGLTATAEAHGFYYAHPDGTVDKSGNYFWNATDACCNYYGSKVDDSAYLASIIAEIQARYDVDPKRIYLIGHSNGGFMSYRMACEHAGTIAAIATLAGAMWEDPTKCAPEGPVSVLQIHGTDDPEVLYAGSPGNGTPGNGPYPSAETSVQDWAKIDGCALTPDTSAPPLDLDTQIPGAETTVERYATGCKAGSGVELWSIQGGVHIPQVADAFREDVIAWLLAHPKP